MKLPSARVGGRAYSWAKRNFPLEPGTRAANDGYKAGYAAAIRDVRKALKQPARTPPHSPECGCLGCMRQ